jgi:O-antigen/teichoic acid export membrane protein
MVSLHRLTQILRNDLRPGTERGRLVRATVATATMKVAATGIAFLASLLYARVLGPHDFGLYAYVMAWTAVLTIPASMGIPYYLVREAARRTDLTLWLRHWADRRICVTGALAGLLLACATWLPQAADARRLFLLAAPIPLLANLSAVRQSLLQAHSRIIRSQWPQLVFAPALALILLATWWQWHGAFDAADAVIATVVAALLQLAINLAQLDRVSHADAHPVHRAAISINAALPFMWLNGLYLVMSRIDLILLGSIKGASEAGIYAIASRAAEFVPFFLLAINISIAPKISHLYHSGEHEKLQRLATASARRLVWVTLPVTLVLIILAQPLIKFLYGDNFAEGAIALQILAVAQFFTIASGPVGILLNMTNHANTSAKSFAAGAIANVILNLALIPRFGYAGAATATAASIAFCNALRWYWVRRYLKLKPSAFGI